MEHILTWLVVPRHYTHAFTVGKDYPLSPDETGRRYGFINDTGSTTFIETLHHYKGRDMEWVTRLTGPINVEELL